MDEPHPPWWRKRRWQAGILAWLLLPALHVLSMGPVDYAWVRGWVGLEFRNAWYRPTIPLYRGPAGVVYERYLLFWEDAARQVEVEESHERARALSTAGGLTVNQTP